MEDFARLQTALVGTRFAAPIQHLPSVDSTNTRLLAAAAEGAPEGTVFLADEQTAGRGRGGNSWHSQPGQGLYVSALVKPSLHLRDALRLSLATGLAAWQAVHQVTGLQLDLHWPNDLYLNGKKLGGILVETAVEPATAAEPDPLLRYAVIGVGINLTQTFPPALAATATSLHLELPATPIERAPLLRALLRALDLELTLLEAADGPTALLERFTTHSTWVCGRRVRVPEQGGYTGTTAGLDPHGFLLVDDERGQRRTVLSGGVRDLDPM